ncbi:hypothetical protein AERO9A_250109 [Aeromonas salmonicida]|nr:hypothetical protein AERO9A_250109 [Aeromonas salmonicida]
MAAPSTTRCLISPVAAASTLSNPAAMSLRSGPNRRPDGEGWARNNSAPPHIPSQPLSLVVSTTKSMSEHIFVIFALPIRGPNRLSSPFDANSMIGNLYQRIVAYIFKNLSGAGRWLGKDLKPLVRLERKLQINSSVE